MRKSKTLKEQIGRNCEVAGLSIWKLEEVFDEDAVRSKLRKSSEPETRNGKNREKSSGSKYGVGLLRFCVSLRIENEM